MKFVSTELRGLAGPDELYDALAGMEGEVYRQVASRRTFRFEHGGQHYFAKVHSGVGWKEIFKNLSQLRLPVIGANNEWRALKHLEQLGIPTLTPVAYSETGRNPARRRSCIVTSALTNTLSLEDLVLAGPVAPPLRRRLIVEVARMSRLMHANGLNHRDLYICHFHLDLSTKDTADPQLHIIDLHRAQLRRRTPMRWVVKDVGGLFFSVFDAGLTRRDLFRFVRHYSGKRLSTTLHEDRRFWDAVIERARRLYVQENGTVPAHVEGLLR